MSRQALRRDAERGGGAAQDHAGRGDLLFRRHVRRRHRRTENGIRLHIDLGGRAVNVRLGCVVQPSTRDANDCGDYHPQAMSTQQRHDCRTANLFPLCAVLAMRVLGRVAAGAQVSLRAGRDEIRATFIPAPPEPGTR